MLYQLPFAELNTQYNKLIIALYDQYELALKAGDTESADMLRDTCLHVRHAQQAMASFQTHKENKA
jgi:hypothetical protein